MMTASAFLLLSSRKTSAFVLKVLTLAPGTEAALSAPVGPNLDGNRFAFKVLQALDVVFIISDNDSKTGRIIRIGEVTAFYVLP